jgi:hypothetical protein
MLKPTASIALAAALLVPLLVAGKKKEASLVGFHLESEESDAAKKTTRVVVDGQTFRVRREPVFSQGDITGYYPFLAKDGKSFGTAFRLDDGASKKLHALSTKAIGRKLLTVVDTDTIAFVVIDGQVDDNYVICWKGLTKKHLSSFEMAGFKKIEPQRGGATSGDRSDDFLPLPGSTGEPPLPGS